MADQHLEPAAFIFPLPAHLKEQYLNWSASFQNTQGAAVNPGDSQEFTPVFVPVYPAYPGAMPYPPFYPGNPAGADPCHSSATRFPGINPFILFLILILLLLGTRKDQILESLRKLLLKTEGKTERKTKGK